MLDGEGGGKRMRIKGQGDDAGGRLEITYKAGFDVLCIARWIENY